MKAMLILLLLVGCVPIEYDSPNVLYVQNVSNVTVYVQNYTVEYINTTQMLCTNNNTVVDPIAQSDYVISLIRQVKRCESSVYKNYSLNDYRYELEKVNESLRVCNDTLSRIRDVLD